MPLTRCRPTLGAGDLPTAHVTAGSRETTARMPGGGGNEATQDHGASRVPATSGGRGDPEGPGPGPSPRPAPG